ncbi:protein phosphatase 2C domain-containing protein [Streptomyces syringium]|uniref:protein phosphatase 2C domain-containing protein n=1 Tax=Streptomyces syringium TaxID=76729 RepID=UPI003AAF8C78
MNQQGDRYADQEDAWWGELYGRSEPDPGSAAEDDSLDDRFISAAAVVRAEPRVLRGAEPPAPPGPRPSQPPRRTEAVSRSEPVRRSGPGSRPGHTEAAKPVRPSEPAPPAPAPRPPAPRASARLTDTSGPPAPADTADSADSGGPKAPPDPPAPPDAADSAGPPPPSPPGRGLLPVPKSWGSPQADALPVPPQLPPPARPSNTRPERPRKPPRTDPRAQVPPPRLPLPQIPQAPQKRSAPAESPTRPLPAVPSAPPTPAAPPAPTRVAIEPGRTAGELDAGSGPEPTTRLSSVPRQTVRTANRAAEFVGQGPPTYDAEPTAWPPAAPGALDDLVPDTVVDGARYGVLTLRALSLRGDSARYRGEPRRDALLTARFGEGDDALLLVAVASGGRAAEGAHRAARDACAWLADAVGRSHPRLVEDIRRGRRGELRSGLHRLTDRSYGRLRGRAADLGLRPAEYTAAVRCLLLPADARCRTRVFFGVGAGGLFRLREGAWQDLDPAPREADGNVDPIVGRGSGPADRITVDLGIATPGTAPVIDPVEVPSEPFRFRASVARPGDVLLLCSAGLADPMRGEPALGDRLAERWTGQRPPGLAAFLADGQLRVKGYADDRTACAVWEA